MNKIHWGLLTVFFLLPGSVQAAVLINEVAWMGDADSANHEWIELYNNGSATALDGWSLSDGRNITIELAGTIPAHAYAVLERTSEQSAPSAAFLIYTGALTNSGATLSLYDANGLLVDQVAGGEAWVNIGGDNGSKATAQYTQSGWVTADGTPGSQNKTQSSLANNQSTPTTDNDKAEETNSPKTKESDATDSKKSSGASPSKISHETVRLTLPDVTLQLTIDGQSVGYVNQSIPFEVTASAVGKTLKDSLTYQWNFGDGNTANSKSPEHTFAYPGRYVVTLYAQYKRQQQIARHEITILPVKLSLTENQQGDIQLNNDSPYEIDLSGYTIKGQKHFVFPQYSLILPNQTITIPRAKIADSKPVLASVYDTQQVQLASSNRPSTLTTKTNYQVAAEAPTVAYTKKSPSPAAVPSAQATNSPALATKPEFSVVANNETITESPLQKKSSQGSLINPSGQLAAAASNIGSLTRRQRLSYAGLAIVILLSIMTIYLTPRRQPLE